MELALGPHVYDVTYRALVMGILNRTPDSFYDKGQFWDLDAFYKRAESLVLDGVDLLDVGGVKAGPGPEVSEAEELDRVVGVIDELHRRFDVPLSCDTWRASVAKAAYGVGAVVGNDISGFDDPAYLEVSAAAGASVVATHIRLGPRIPDPEPRYGDVVAEVNAFLGLRAQKALDAGIPAQRIILDSGLDLGKTWQQSVVLLRHSSSLVALGFPVLLSASNKTFLGKMFDLEIDQRREISHAAHAMGIAGGCRILRAHDVRGARHVADVMAALLEAENPLEDKSQ